MIKRNTKGKRLSARKKSRKGKKKTQDEMLYFYAQYNEDHELLYPNKTYSKCMLPGAWLMNIEGK